MADLDKGYDVPETPERALKLMPFAQQVAVMRQIFTEEDLVNFTYFGIQDICTMDEYLTQTATARQNAGVGPAAITYILRNNLLDGREDQLRTALDNLA